MCKVYNIVKYDLITDIHAYTEDLVKWAKDWITSQSPEVLHIKPSIEKIFGRVAIHFHACLTVAIATYYTKVFLSWLYVHPCYVYYFRNIKAQCNSMYVILWCIVIKYTVFY